MAKRSFKQNQINGNKWSFFVILAVIILAGLLCMYGWTTPWTTADGKSIRWKGASEIRYGIDIRGGVEAVFAPKDFDKEPTPEELEAAAQVLNFRLDQLQILDREVTTSSSASRVIVRFPWKSDEKDFNPEKALSELGEMALLTFKNPDGSVAIDGTMVKNAQAVYDPRTNEPMVALELTEEGKERFAEATKKNLGQKISIYLDDNLLSDPVVRDVIADGHATISGQFKRDDAIKLASRINGGALPFAMTAISSSTISPRLGQNSLEIMYKAGLYSFIVICAIMIFMYRLSGVVACLSLTAQVIGILLAISLPQQTLTLQGIAGIILSIGMGVDANIIIAERIKEEANEGASIPTFLYRGFTRAFSSVMDGNVTVAIAAIVLMIFGSGSVLSFGYSLLAGVILNGITGVYMTRRMIASLSSYSALQKPWLYGRDKKPRERKIYPIFAKRKLWLGIAVAAMVISLVWAMISGFALSIQFKGGSLISYDYEGEVNPDTTEKTLRKQIDLPIQVQLTKGLSDDSNRLQISVAQTEPLTPEELSQITELLHQEYPDGNFVISSSQLVNPSIGGEMLRRGIIALFVASLLIVAYVWFSFRSMSGPSAGFVALLSLFHDIFLATMVFIIIGSEINETLIAVVLTILGFSINDTIVIYDRIREFLPKYEKKVGFEKTIDMAVSYSMGRTFMTSLCMLIAVLFALVFAVINDLDSIREFAAPILAGIICGTYSSQLISAPLWAWWKTRHGGKDAGAVSEAASEA